MAYSSLVGTLASPWWNSIAEKPSYYVTNSHGLHILLEERSSPAIHGKEQFIYLQSFI